MHRLPNRLIALPVLVVALGVLAACGGSSKAATTSTAVTTAVPSAAASCAQVAGLESAFTKALSGTVPSNLTARVKLFEQFADKTPTSIRPDFKIVAGEVSKIIAALKGVKLTSGAGINPTALAKLGALETELKGTQFSKALTAIEAWAAAGCKG